jgi:hypothetical protein
MRLALLVFLLLPMLAWGATATINWQNPTQNEDGSAIPATGAGSIASTRIEWGTCSGTAFGTKQGERVFTAPATSGAIDGLAAGATFCFRGFSTNTFGQSSAASNVVARLIPAPTPRPPVLSSTVTVVWSYKRTGRGETLEVVGTAPLGTPCGALVVESSGMYEVDRTAVTLDRPLRGGIPVTMCDWS